MRIKETKVYTFDELSDNAQQKAIEKLYNINVDYEWWDGIYDDAETIGLKLTGFDIGRGNYAEGDFVNSAAAVAEAILENHGKMTATYTTAKNFLKDLEELTGKYKDIEDCPEDEIEALEDEFLKSLLEDYRIILSKEYDYLTSEEAIVETININEYEFDENGNLA